MKEVVLEHAPTHAMTHVVKFVQIRAQAHAKVANRAPIVVKVRVTLHVMWDVTPVVKMIVVAHVEMVAQMRALAVRNHVPVVEVNVLIHVMENALKPVQPVVVERVKLDAMIHVLVYVKTNVEICVCRDVHLPA